MTRLLLRSIALLAAALVPLAPRADPLHPLAGDGYWHHESNFIFPPTLAGFTRAGAPQELDGSTTVVAYYARGTGDARLLVEIHVMPVAEAAPDTAPPEGGKFARVIERGGWRIAVSAPLSDATAAAALEALVRALPVSRLGTIDARCPNAGCGA